jgi:hypothetical protein
VHAVNPCISGLGSGASEGPPHAAIAFPTCARHASSLTIASQRGSARSAQQRDQPAIPDNKELEDPSMKSPLSEWFLVKLQVSHKVEGSGRK